jgi:two-component system cell cycle sensor histidine kinase/response regulator CckA
LVLPAALCLAAAIYLPQVQVGLFLFFLGLILLAAAAIFAITQHYRRWQKSRYDRTLFRIHVADPAPVVVTTGNGDVRFVNEAAKEAAPKKQKNIGDILYGLLPNAQNVARQITTRLEIVPSAREVFFVRGRSVVLSASRTAFGDITWRIESVEDKPNGQRSSDHLAVPILTASKAGTVLYMNEAMRRLLGGRRPHLERIFNDLPLQHDHLHEIMGADGKTKMRVAVFEGALGRQEVFLFDPVLVAGPVLANWNGIETLPVALLRLDHEGSVQDSNAMARRLLLLEPGETIRFANLVEGLGRSIPDWLDDIARKTRQPTPEFVRANRHSADVFLQINVSVTGPPDRPNAVIVLNDATELKTLEGQFIQSQKMQAIGQLAGGVAHDFNNLLTAISGHCDLMMLRHDESDPDYGDLVQIHQNANRAASLVGQLLAFSRKQTLTPEIIDVTEALDDMTHLLGRLVGETITLDQDHPGELSKIRADKRQLEQVIMNLVVNARDAMTNGGTIRIASHEETLKMPYERDHATVPAGDYVVITVQDQGQGIPPDKLSKIFEPFFTTKRTGEGTGLGLSMVYGIVRQTGGYIFVDSAVGRGTTFTMFFPVFATPEPLVLEKPQPDVPARHLTHERGVILLVEDEAPVRAFASRALKMRGYTVIEAESAEDALAKLEDPDLAVDVFVTDVVMPGMDGPSWVTQARMSRPDTKVVFVSGYSEENLSDQQARIPNSVFLPKPFSLSELAATVGAQMG